MYTPVTEARPISPSAGIESAVNVVVQIEGRRRATPSRHLGGAARQRCWARAMIGPAGCWHRIGQQRQADSLLRRSPTFPAQPASILKLLVENGKATDHGAAPVRWAGSAFARHNPAGTMEE